MRSRGEMRTRGGAAKPSCHDDIRGRLICLLRLRRWCRLDVGSASAGAAAGGGEGMGMGTGKAGERRARQWP